MKIFKLLFFSLVIASVSIITVNAMEAGQDIPDSIDPFSDEMQQRLEGLCKSDIPQAKELFKVIFDHAIDRVSDLQRNLIGFRNPAKSYAAVAMQLAHAKVNGRHLRTESKEGKESPDYVEFVNNILHLVNIPMGARVGKTTPLFSQEWLPYVLPFVPLLINKPVYNICLSDHEVTYISDEIGFVQEL